MFPTDEFGAAARSFKLFPKLENSPIRAVPRAFPALRRHGPTPRPAMVSPGQGMGVSRTYGQRPEMSHALEAATTDSMDRRLRQAPAAGSRETPGDGDARPFARIDRCHFRTASGLPRRGTNASPAPGRVTAPQLTANPPRRDSCSECRPQCSPTPAPPTPAPNPSQDARSAPSCRPAHKPHSANQTVTVHYRFHPLAGTRVTAVEHRSHRAEPLVAVADSDGKRYHLPLWMTVPEAEKWGLRERPRLSLSALSEVRDLIAAWSAEPARPATGERDEISNAGKAAEDADVRAAAPGQPGGSGERRGGQRSGGADCGGDAPAHAPVQRISLALPHRGPAWGPDKGNDKGAVEGLEGCSRRNFMAPLPRFASIEALNVYLEQRCRERQGDVLRGHREGIAKRLERDLEAMTVLPGAPFDACHQAAGQVSSQSLVRYHDNDYSVPVAYGYRQVNTHTTSVRTAASKPRSALLPPAP